MTEKPFEYTRLAQSLARAAGRDPSKFSVVEVNKGTVRVSGSGASAFYPQEAWTSKFMRHLHQGFYDAQARLHPEVKDELVT